MYRSDNRPTGKGIISTKNLISVAALATLLWQNASPCSSASLIEVGRKGPATEIAPPPSPLNNYEIALLIDKSRSMTRGVRGIQDGATGSEPAAESYSTNNTGLPPEPEVLNAQKQLQQAIRNAVLDKPSHEEKAEQIDRVLEHRAIVAAEEQALSPKERRTLQQERHRQRAARIHEEREAITRQKAAERAALKAAKANQFSEYVSYEDSRWAWCQKQAQALSAKLSALQPEGIRTILFSDDVVENDKSDAGQIQELFQTTQPIGATRAAEPLRREFEKYFAQRAANPTGAKPLLVAIITDGFMNDKYAVKREIVRACDQIDSQNEILVVFLTVGTEGHVPLFLRELDNLSPIRAKYDIVEVRTFDELDAKGLGGVLEELVTSRQKPIKTAQVQ